MDITVAIADYKIRLLEKAYQHECAADTYQFITDTMTESIDKLTRELEVCPQCKKVFKRCYKGQEYCSHDCKVAFEQKAQPDLPFSEETDEQ